MPVPETGQSPAAEVRRGSNTSLLNTKEPHGWQLNAHSKKKTPKVATGVASFQWNTFVPYLPLKGTVHPKMKTPQSIL